MPRAVAVGPSPDRRPSGLPPPPRAVGGPGRSAGPG